MQVKKKELVDRTFIPYELTITVSSEKEHNDLSRDAYVMRNKIEIKDRLRRSGVLIDVLNKIIEHTK